MPKFQFWLTGILKFGSNKLGEMNASCGTVGDGVTVPGMGMLAEAPPIKVKNILLERRIAAGVAKQVPENAVVENPVPGAHGSLAFLERIPTKAGARLEVHGVVVVQQVSIARPHQAECK